MNWTRWIIVGLAVVVVAGGVFLAGRGDLLFTPPPPTPEERGETPDADEDPAGGVADPAGEGVAPTAVHLAAGPASFDGRVWRGENPEPGARVTLHLEPPRPTYPRGPLRALDAPSGDLPVLSETTTNASGRFRFSGLASGTYVLRAEATDGARARIVYAVGGGRTASVRLEVNVANETLEGRAVYGHGGPFRGLVRTGNRYAEHVRTDGEGRFRLERLPPGKVSVVLLDPGRLHLVRSVEIPHDGVFTIVVDENLKMLRGRVVAADDESPIPGAEVQVDGSQRGYLAGTIADEAGRFLVPVPEQGTLRAQAEGFARSSVVHWTSGHEVVIRLVRGASVSGRVIDRETRAPVPGVPVRVGAGPRPSPPIREAPRTTSDDAGRYEVEGVGPGDVTILAMGNGWVSEGLPQREDGTTNPLNVATEAGRPAEHDLVVVRTGRVEGVVLGTAGKPAAGVGIEVVMDRSWRGFGHRTEGVTDADGKYIVAGLVPGVPYVVSAVPGDGAAAKGETPVRLEPGGVARVDLRLPPPRWIDVIVTERGSGKAVVMAGVTGGGDRRHHALSDDDGMARLGPFGPGPVRVRVDHGHYFCPRESVVAPEGETHVAIVLERGLPIAGRVVLPEGVHRYSVSVNLVEPGDVARDHRIRTSSRLEDDGGFHLGPVPAGSHEVVVRVFHRTGTLEPVREWCEAGREDLVLTVPTLPPEKAPEASEHGRLVVRPVGPDGKPPIGGTIRIVPVEGGTKSPWRSLLGVLYIREGQPTAAWSIRKPDEKIFLVASGAKGADGKPIGAVMLGPMEAKPGEVVLRFPAGRTIAGRVLGPSGEGVRGLRVTALPHPEGSFGFTAHGTATTGAEGRFVLEGLGDTTYRVGVEAPPRYRKSEGVTARAGATDVVVRMQVGGRIAIRILRPDGTPCALGEALLVRAGTSEQAGDGFTGQDGRCHVGSLDPDGEFDLLVQHRRDGLVGQRKGLRPGAEEAVVRLEPGLTIRGRILGISQGRNVWVEAVTPAGLWWETSVSSDGRFALRGLRPGVWKLQVYARDSVEPIRVVEVRAGESVEIDLEDR